MRRLTPFSLPFFKGGLSFRDRFEGFVDSLLFRIYLFGLVPVIAICALGINILYPKGYDYVHITEEQSQLDTHRTLFSLYTSLVEEQRESVIYALSAFRENRNKLADVHANMNMHLASLEASKDELKTKNSWVTDEGVESALIEKVLKISERLERLRFGIKAEELTDATIIYDSYTKILADLRVAFEEAIAHSPSMAERSVTLLTAMDAVYALSSLELQSQLKFMPEGTPSVSTYPHAQGKAEVYLSLIGQSLPEVERFSFSMGEQDIMAYLAGVDEGSYERSIKALDDLSSDIWTQVNTEMLAKQGMILRSFTAWAFGVVSLLLLMTWFGWMIAGRIRKGVAEVTAALDALKNCELSRRCDLYGHDEFSKLGDTYNNVAEHLEGVIETVRGTSKDLMEETQKVALNSSRMSVSCHDQVKSIGHIQTAMDASSSAVTNANEAARIATHMIQKMTGNLSAVNASVKDLETNADEISFVTDSIDEIAGKINLLSLNAAIEAARAGEAGQGFAVVADEIRKLAQSAAKSNAQIKSAMEKMAENVRDSVGEIHGVSTILGDVEGKVQHLNQTMDSQMTAYGNMVNAIEDFNMRMDTLKADVDATNSVAGTLSQYAYNMDYQVQVFSLTGDTPLEEEVNITDDEDIDLF